MFGENLHHLANFCDFLRRIGEIRFFWYKLIGVSAGVRERNCFRGVIILGRRPTNKCQTITEGGA